MKTRKGFVSNSSSSSFVCSICNEGFEVEYSFIEGDPEIRQCVKGHIFCKEHATKDYEYTLAMEYNILYDNHDHEKLSESMYMNIPEKYCPICNKVYIPNDMLIEYMLKKYNVSRKDVEEMIRND